MKRLAAGLPRPAKKTAGTSRRSREVVKPFSPHEAALFFERLKRRNADPRTELVYASPFTLLVAVVLSAQATDKGVNKATERLFKVVQTPEGMLRLGES